MMKGVLLKDLYIAKSNILVTVVSLVVLGFGLSFFLETSALLVLALVASTTAVFISITSDADSKWNKNVTPCRYPGDRLSERNLCFTSCLPSWGCLPR